jgi:predicted transcriptional regulator
LKYRTRNEIIVDILTSAEEIDGVPKTKIMYQAFLSFAQLKEYVVLLLQNGMLEHDPQTNKYKTTQKGVKMIEAYQKINDMVSE